MSDVGRGSEWGEPARCKSGLKFPFTTFWASQAESFVSTLKVELVSRVQFPTRQAAKTAILDYLETFYNRMRLHSALGYRSPIDFEEDRMREAGVA